jgi:NitT/TauT family transport system permease protein
VRPTRSCATSFAALTLLVLTGVLIFWSFNALSRALLGRWHAVESSKPD